MSDLLIKERRASPSVTILDMEGDILFGEGTIDLRQEIRRLLEAGKKNLLLNFARVEYVDSSGIGELVASFISAQRQGGRLVILNLPERNRAVLGITNLLRVFDIYTDEAEAIKSFG